MHVHRILGRWKGWRLWCDNGKTFKCFISHNDVFRETKYYMESIDQLVEKCRIEEIHAKTWVAIEVELVAICTKRWEKTWLVRHVL